MGFFQSLPLLALFGLTLLLGLAVCALVLAIVRMTLRAMGIYPGQTIALRDALMNSVGAIFALMLAFSAAGIWNDIVQARTAVEREANALENVLALAGSLPPDLQPEIRNGVRRYAREVIETDWPAMALAVNVNDTVFNKTDDILVGMIDLLSVDHAKLGASSLVTLLVGQIVEARSARLARITLAASGVSAAQWLAMLVLAIAVLIVIALCHNDRPKIQILGMTVYAIAAASAFFVILAHDRPFVGTISVGAAPLLHIADH